MQQVKPLPYLETASSYWLHHRLAALGVPLADIHLGLF